MTSFLNFRICPVIASSLSFNALSWTVVFRAVCGLLAYAFAVDFSDVYLQIENYLTIWTIARRFSFEFRLIRRHELCF